MATIAIYAGKMNQMSSLLEEAKKSVSDYQAELFSLKSRTLNVNKSVCDLDDVIGSIQSSTQLQEQKADSLETLRQNVDNFIADVVRIDGDAAEVINRNKDEFYDKYSYLKPDCEKNLWEKICDGFASAVEWCKEHWKLVVTIVLVVAAVVLICTGVGGPFAAIILGAAKGLVAGAVTGGLMGGLSSLAAGGSFFEGFEDGAFMGALTGALFGGIGGAGEALGALGKLGTTCEALGRLEKLAKISGTISLGMGTFDLLAWGAGLFAPDNAFTAFNQQLHSNSLYNAFQFGASALAVFSLGGIKGFYEKTPDPLCFVAGTMVLTASGLTAIENIRAGDKVISTNADTFETEEKTVLETYIRRTDKLIHLVINGEEIITTEAHPFYVKERGFVDAGSLLIGDPLIDVHGNILVVENTRTEYLDEPETVYNFQVEDFHTYYVGNNSILVHNKCIHPKEKGVENPDGSITYTKCIDGKNVSVTYSKEGYPDFSPYAETLPNGQKSVRINYSGSRSKDFRLADKAAGYTRDNPRPSGYTWHHNEDMTTMQLVNSRIHNGSQGGFPHSGGIDKWQQLHNTRYK